MQGPKPHVKLCVFFHSRNFNPHSQNAYKELLLTPAEVFPVSIMETECPNLKLEHDENRTLEKKKKKIVEAII